MTEVRDVTMSERVGATRAPQDTVPAVSLRGAALRFGARTLWDGLDLDVAPGEFIAVLGPNGSGKTTLLRVLLGIQPLHAGQVLVEGRPPARGSRAIGYIPQQKALAEDLPLRARDLVGLGLDGHRPGLGLRGRAARREKVAAALASVGAQRYADAPVGRLSGGEQQRLRVAQALVGDPSVLLCDEPLLSLDLAHQQVVSSLIDRRRRSANTAVVFVTHEINPVLPLVDRVLYLVDGRFRVGTPDEVMTSETLSELYRTDVDVLRVRGRLVVVGADAHCHPAEEET
jgi:zinc/manganese transport system ATP-binding protein